MPWFKLDDGFLTHPKVVRVGPEAGWLYIAGLAYCSRYLTDGLIPVEALPTLCAVKNPRRLAGLLIAVELWHEVDGFYEVHDYLEYQSSRDDVAKVRRDAAARARSSRESRANHSRSSRDVREPELDLELSEPIGSSTEIAPKEKRKREPDPWWDALVEVFGDATFDERQSMYGKAVRAFKTQGIDPEEIVARGNRIPSDWNASTPMALLKHWDTLDGKGKPEDESLSDYLKRLKP